MRDPSYYDNFIQGLEEIRNSGVKIFCSCNEGIFIIEYSINDQNKDKIDTSKMNKYNWIERGGGFYYVHWIYKL